MSKIRFTQHVTRPAQPLYETLPRKIRSLIHIEEWIDAALHTRNWSERAAAFDRLILHIFEKNPSLVPQAIGVGASHYATFALEHLGTTEVTDLDSAFCYAISMHPEWRAAGDGFLDREPPAKLRQWLHVHPGFARIVQVQA
jgi:hypothetical protein